MTCERIAPADTTPNLLGDPNLCQTNDLLGVQSQTTFTLITPIVAQFVGGFTLTGDALVTVNQ